MSYSTPLWAACIIGLAAPYTQSFFVFSSNKSDLLPDQNIFVFDLRIDISKDPNKNKTRRSTSDWNIIDHFTLDLIYDFDKDTWRAANRAGAALPVVSHNYLVTLWKSAGHFMAGAVCRGARQAGQRHYCVHSTSLGSPLSLLQMSERSSFPSLSLCLLFLLGVLMTHWAGWIETWLSSLTSSIFQPLQSPFPQNM